MNENSQDLLNFLLFSLVVFNSALDRPTQQIFTHYAEMDRT